MAFRAGRFPVRTQRFLRRALCCLAVSAAPLVTSARTTTPALPSVEVNLDVVKNLRSSAPVAVAPLPLPPATKPSSIPAPTTRFSGRKTPIEQPILPPESAHVPPAMNVPSPSKSKKKPTKAAVVKSAAVVKKTDDITLPSPSPASDLSPLPSMEAPKPLLPPSADPMALPPGIAPLPATAAAIPAPAPLPSLPVKTVPPSAPKATPTRIMTPPGSALPALPLPSAPMVEEKMPTTPPVPASSKTPVVGLKKVTPEPAFPPADMPVLPDKPAEKPVAKKSVMPSAAITATQTAPSLPPLPSMPDAPLPLPPLAAKSAPEKAKVEKSTAAPMANLGLPPLSAMQSATGKINPAMLPPTSDVAPPALMPPPAVNTKMAKPLAPMTDRVPPALPPIAVPKPGAVRTENAPAPDISKLDFSKLPQETSPPAPVPAVVSKAQPKTVFVQSDTLKPIPQIEPLTPPPVPLPPTVEKRLEQLTPEPKKQGIISDKTRIDNPLVKTEQEAKAKQMAATLAKDKQTVEDKVVKEQAATEAALRAAKPPALAEPKKADLAVLPPKEFTSFDADKTATKENKAKELPPIPAKKEMVVLKTENLPPDTLPPPPVVATATITKPVILPESKIAPLPMATTKKPVPELPLLPKLPTLDAPLPETSTKNRPTLPALPLPPGAVGNDAALPPLNLPKLPGAAPTLPVMDAPTLPSLTALTGGKTPSTMDILQPKDGIDSKPLGAALAPPKLPPIDSATKKDAIATKADSTEKPEVKTESKHLPPVLALPKLPASDAALPPKALELPPLPVTTPKPAILDEKPAKKEAAVTKDSSSAEKLAKQDKKDAPIPKELTKEPTKSEAKDSKTEAKKDSASSAPVTNDAAPKITRTLSFAKDKTDLSDDAKSDLGDIAEKVKQSQGTVRIVAYASGTPEQSSVATRISLSRALQIRAFLIGKGVNQLSINVQSLGNKVPNGDADRADIFLK